MAQETIGYDATKVRERTERIYDTILQILERGRAAQCSTQTVADAMVEEILARGRVSPSASPLRLARV